MPENESQPVRLSEFLLDKSADIWVPPASSARGAVAFSYTDGAEEETRLLRVLREATDLSDNASTLLSYVNDWPSHYHLAPGRANAIRALDLPHDIQILELGAGCGALSRHLGENYKVVHSVEGSAFRSAICRARCAGLSNVKVHCADFSDVALDPVYDVVILNGVLEYAPSFFRNQLTSDPAESLIRFAKSALREGGILVIGIENKLGLKYWCGAPEDHTSTLYEGVHGYPSTDKVRTFSRREIRDLLDREGFASSAFFYCFPDYKFPSTIFSDCPDPLRDRLYLYNWIDYPAECPGLGRTYTIHEGLAARSVYEAGLLEEAANSFVVVGGTAGAEQKFETALQPAWIAKRVSVRGRDKSRHRVTALARVSGELAVTKEPVHYPGSYAPHQSRPLVAPWVGGELLLLEMSRAMIGRRQDDTVHELLAEYHAELLARFATGDKDAEGYPLLRSRCLDFLLRNIIRGPKGLVAIDLEWEAVDVIAADYMLFRCLWHDVIGPNRGWADRQIPDLDVFMVRAIRRFYASYGFGRHSKNKRLERQFLAKVGGAITPLARVWETTLGMRIGALVRTVVRPVWRKVQNRVDGG